MSMLRIASIVILSAALIACAASDASPQPTTQPDESANASNTLEATVPARDPTSTTGLIPPQETATANAEGTAFVEANPDVWITRTATTEELEATSHAISASITEADIPMIRRLDLLVQPATNHFSPIRIQEVRGCFANDWDERFQSVRYPQHLTIDQLAGIYMPQTACDWALLADAYAQRILVEDESQWAFSEILPMPLYGEYAFATAVNANPVYAAATGDLFAAYFAKLELIDPIQINSEIVAVDVYFEYGAQGFGYIERNFAIIQASTDPIAYEVAEFGHGYGEAETVESLTANPSIETIQRLSSAFTHLLPINTLFEYQFGGPVCGEFGGEWRVDVANNGAKCPFRGWVQPGKAEHEKPPQPARG